MSGYNDGLRRAREFVMAAPLHIASDLLRDPAAKGGFPRVADHMNDDGLCPNGYVLRDAVLHWIDRELAATDNPTEP